MSCTFITTSIATPCDSLEFPVLPTIFRLIRALRVSVADVTTSDQGPKKRNELSVLFGAKSPQPLRQLDPLINSPFARQHERLDGTWRVIVDQLDIGFASALTGGVGLGTDDPGPSEVREYSFVGGHEVQVPGDWNTQIEELFWYRGICWYQRRFEYRHTAGTRSLLYFGGANLAADVFVNGQMLMQHRGGFTPFNADATDVLVDGENVITVRVNSMSASGDVPTERNDWMNYGGITREVLIVTVPDTHVLSWQLWVEPDRPGRVTGWIDVVAEAYPAKARAEIPALGVDAVVTAEGPGRTSIDFEAAPELWAPDNPVLYDVYLSVVESDESRVCDQIGFRTIETSGTDIVLNGEPVFLHGISMHEESVLHPGRAYGPEDASAAIALIKDLGCNFVRLGHYPHNEHMIRACDRAGILVWSELPVYHGVDFADPAALVNARSQLAEVIDRDRNRSSVVLWSVANETPNTDDRNSFLRTMISDARANDPTRLITAALLGFSAMKAIGEHSAARLRGEHRTEMPVSMVDDPLGADLDVIGWNQYVGWYIPNFISDRLGVEQSELRRVILEDLPDFGLDTEFGKPMIVSEVGAGALAGKHGAADEAWTEELQDAVYRSEITMLLRNSPPVAGVSPWILKDFRAPYRLNTEFQGYWNRKGLVSPTGERKQAFATLRELYRNHRTQD